MILGGALDYLVKTYVVEQKSLFSQCIDRRTAGSGPYAPTKCQTYTKQSFKLLSH